MTGTILHQRMRSYQRGINAGFAIVHKKIVTE